MQPRDLFDRKQSYREVDQRLRCANVRAFLGPDRKQIFLGAPLVTRRHEAIYIRGPRIIAVASNPEHLWSEQHGIKTRTKRNHSRTNSGRLTIGGNYSRSP
jgi:hypothetical protein